MHNERKNKREGSVVVCNDTVAVLVAQREGRGQGSRDCFKREQKGVIFFTILVLVVLSRKQVWSSLRFLFLWSIKKTSVVFFTSLVLVIQSRKQVWSSLRFLFLWSIKKTSVVFFTSLVLVIQSRNQCGLFIFLFFSFYQENKCAWSSLLSCSCCSIKKTSEVFFTSSVLLVLSKGDIVFYQENKCDLLYYSCSVGSLNRGFRGK